VKAMDYLHPEADDAGIGELSALALAHLGDGVYELMVRTWCVLHRKLTNRSLHSAVVRYVAAPAQAAAARRIEAAVDKACARGIKPMEFGGHDGTAQIARAVVAEL